MTLAREATKGAGEHLDPDPDPARPPLSTRGSSTALVLLASLYLWQNAVELLPLLGEGISDFSFYHLAAAALVAGDSPFSVPSFDYPPLLAFVVAPLGILAYADARLLWFVFGHLCIVFAGYWTWRGLGRSQEGAWAVGLTWAAAGSVAVSLREGQVNGLLLALVCLALWPPVRHPIVRDLALGTAIALKLWPGVLLAADALQRRWHRMLWTTAAAVALVAAPLAVVAVALDGPWLPPRASYWQGTPAFLNGSLPAFTLRLLDRPAQGEPLPANWVRGNNTEGLELAPRHARISVAVAAGALLAGLLALGAVAGPAPATPTSEPRCSPSLWWRLPSRGRTTRCCSCPAPPCSGSRSTNAVSVWPWRCSPRHFWS
jgi:hypothetical protein